MARFRRMDEVRRRAGGGEGGGNLAADMPGLADARNDYAASRGQYGLDRMFQILRDVAGQYIQRLRLGDQHLPRGGHYGYFGLMCRFCHLLVV